MGPTCPEASALSTEYELHSVLRVPHLVTACLSVWASYCEACLDRVLRQLTPEGTASHSHRHPLEATARRFLHSALSDQADLPQHGAPPAGSWRTPTGGGPSP